MDLLLYLLGDWSEIRATIGTLDRQIEVEDVSMAVVRFDNGTINLIAPNTDIIANCDRN